VLNKMSAAVFVIRNMFLALTLFVLLTPVWGVDDASGMVEYRRYCLEAIERTWDELHPDKEVVEDQYIWENWDSLKSESIKYRENFRSLLELDDDDLRALIDKASRGSGPSKLSDEHPALIQMMLFRYGHDLDFLNHVARHCSLDFGLGLAAEIVGDTSKERREDGTVLPINEGYWGFAYTLWRRKMVESINEDLSYLQDRLTDESSREVDRAAEIERRRSLSERDLGSVYFSLLLVRLDGKKAVDLFKRIYQSKQSGMVGFSQDFMFDSLSMIGEIDADAMGRMYSGEFTVPIGRVYSNIQMYFRRMDYFIGNKAEIIKVRQDIYDAIAKEFGVEGLYVGQ
jgi:hypothetical protein